MKRKASPSSPSSKSPAKPPGTARRKPPTANAKPPSKKTKAAPVKRVNLKVDKPLALEDTSTLPGTSKQSQLIALLRGAAGASMDDMMQLTGWQSHTVRGMLSGTLRKRLGLNVQCQRVDSVHRYRIVEASAA